MKCVLPLRNINKPTNNYWRRCYLQDIAQWFASVATNAIDRKLSTNLPRFVSLLYNDLLRNSIIKPDKAYIKHLLKTLHTRINEVDDKLHYLSWYLVHSNHVFSAFFHATRKHCLINVNNVWVMFNYCQSYLFVKCESFSFKLYIN